jgi:hypothetical protein
MPPALETATTTSRQCENAKSGNSMPRRWQSAEFNMALSLRAGGVFVQQACVGARAKLGFARRTVRG